MRVPENCQLIRGPYAAPRCRVGDILTCEARGRDVVVGGLGDATIPWPFVRKRGRPSLIVCDNLVRALQVDAAVAVAHHWGVSTSTVRDWRRAPGVPDVTEGSRRVRLRNITKARPRSWTPEALAKQSRARKGRPRHPNFAAAALKTACRPKSEAWKESMKRSLRAQWAPDGIHRQQKSG